MIQLDTAASLYPHILDGLDLDMSYYLLRQRMDVLTRQPLRI